MTGAPTIAGLWLDGDACAVDAREAWALTATETAPIYAAARAEGFGAALISTCFRVELLLSGERSAADLLAWGHAQLAAARPGASMAAFEEAEGDVALRHLLRVAAGLESAVLGEAQILGQVRRARADAEAAGALAPALREALGAAIRTGQWARRVTDLGRGTASTASAAVQWAAEATGGLAGRHVAVIGAGQIGRLLLGHLADARVGRLTLVSAHAPPHIGFDVVRPDALGEALPDVEVVFASTDRLALPEDVVREAWADGRPRVVVDLGLPRNVDARVGRVPGVRLADAGLAARRAAVPEVEAMIEGALGGLHERLGALVRERLVADFRRRAETIRLETLASGVNLDPDRLTRTLTTRLLHDVTAALRRVDGGVDDAALRRLLDLDAGA